MQSILVLWLLKVIVLSPAGIHYVRLESPGQFSSQKANRKYRVEGCITGGPCSPRLRHRSKQRTSCPVGYLPSTVISRLITSLSRAAHRLIPFRCCPLPRRFRSQEQLAAFELGLMGSNYIPTWSRCAIGSCCRSPETMLSLSFVSVPPPSLFLFEKKN